jgi:hypothetical protein
MDAFGGDGMNDISALSWSEARDLGAKHYFTGKPCKHGHIAKRYANSRICAECLSLENKTEKSIGRMKRWYAAKTHKEKMIGWARYRHKYGGYPSEFDLTEADFDWPELCPALGIKLRYEAQRSRNADDAPTIDRINSSLGYVRGNVQILSRKANRIKNDGSPEEVMRVAMFMAGAGK